MRTILLVFTLFGFLTSALEADFVKPSKMSTEDWESVKPFLLPYNGHLRKKMDKIFSSERVVKNERSLEMNHFYFPHWQGDKRAVVAKHMGIKDYVFKIFLDSQGINEEWRNLVKRVKGAQVIDDFITSRGFHNSFKVPKKWLYVLPESDEPDETVLFVLVAENVGLKSEEANREKWKSPSLKAPFFKQLYTIINELGLLDSLYIDNIPFCRDGKVAFVDTEHHGLTVINYPKLEKYLHRSNRPVWQKLYQN